MQSYCETLVNIAVNTYYSAYVPAEFMDLNCSQPPGVPILTLETVFHYHENKPVDTFFWFWIYFHV